MASIKPLGESTLKAEYNNQIVHDLYAEMRIVFQNNLLVVIVYVLGVLSLGYHLLHGFQSAFQTFGINHKRYTPIIKSLGLIYSVVICLLFASMPVAFYFHWIN